MKRMLTSILLLAMLASCGGSSSPPQVTPTPAPPPPPPTASEQLAGQIADLSLTELYEISFNAFAERSPEGILWRGLSDVFPDVPPTLDDLSQEFRTETFEMHRVTLDALRTHDRTALNADDQLNYDTYEWYLQDVVDRFEFFLYDFIATYITIGVQRDTRQLFTDIHPLTSKQDAEDYITRLNQLARKFDQVVVHLFTQREAGIIEPALSLEVAIFYLGEHADALAEDSVFYTSFRDKIALVPDLNDSERTLLLDDALLATRESVIPGYQALRNAMESLLPNASPSIGVSQFPRGAEYYDYQLRRHTTTNLSAAQVHQLGLDELQRIHAEMRTVFDQLDYPQDETLQELFARVATDGGIVEGTAAISTFESLVEFAESNLAEAFDIAPQSQVAVIADDFGGYYIRPSFDGSRPGAFYAGANQQPYFLMPSLTFHESLPGHHLQLGLLAEQDLPTFRKIIRATASTEGWALYAERLAYELGWYENDPYGNLGRLQYEALRAARLVMDTGIHSLGWSFEEAVAFNQQAIGATRGSSEGAAGRYSVWPGQATAYMVGMLQILDARQRAMDQLGENFDLIEFHRVILQSGPLPLDLLNQVIDRHIADKLGAP